MTTIKHIFFDLDDTIWDFTTNSKLALKHMFAEHKIEETYQISFKEWLPVYKEKNAAAWLAMREKRMTKDELRTIRFKQAFAEFNIHNQKLNETFENEYLNTVTKFNHLVNNAQELLDYLKPKYHLHILTNGFSEVTNRKLQSSNITNYFATVTCADELQTQKPDPKIFEFALEKARAKKEETMFVGDNWISDIVGATNYGLKAIFLDTWGDKDSDLEVEIITDLIQIKEIL